MDQTILYFVSASTDGGDTDMSAFVWAEDPRSALEIWRPYADTFSPGRSDLIDARVLEVPRKPAPRGIVPWASLPTVLEGGD